MRLEPSHLPACHPVPEAVWELHFGAYIELGGLSPGLKAGLLSRAVLGCPRQAGPLHGAGGAGTRALAQAPGILQLLGTQSYLVGWGTQEGLM